MSSVARDQGQGFTVTPSAGGASPRVGRLVTPHGTADTPAFLPIATHGSLRALSFQDAAACGTAIVMANAWHVYREAGAERLQQVGGAHEWMGWRGVLFTDSGGYQVFSLRSGSEIADAGVRFGPELDALTPERVIHQQKRLGSDVMMALDDCAPFPCSEERALDAVRRTTLWAAGSMRAHRETPGCYGRDQQLWGIVQGGVHDHLRRRSVEEIAALDFDGYGIGGLSIGMARTVVRDMTALVCELLPPEKPRHLLGVGLPGQILEGIEDGADTFDCVLPIRKAQRGVVYTSLGELAYKRAPEPGLADAPLDPRCGCPTCQAHSREELRRLYRDHKEAASRLAAIHNTFFYHAVLAGARDAIREGRFPAYKKSFLSDFSSGPDRR